MNYGGEDASMSKSNEKYTGRRLRRYPFFLGILSIGMISVLAQIVAVWDVFFPMLAYQTDAVGSVMSTCCEVVAGLYGITLTGYIFFSDRFQNIPKDDESLYDAVQALVLRYNHMAGFISVMCLVCIVCGEGIVLYGGNTLFPSWLYRLLVNETLLLFFWTFNFILYFVISVLDPHKVSRISTQKKAKLSEDKTIGDSEAFMAAWAAIEDHLEILRGKLISSVRFVPGAGGKNKPRIISTLEILRNYGQISHSLWRKLEQLRQYHNLTLHDLDMTVSQEMCVLAQELLTQLRKKTEDSRQDTKTE